MRQGRRQVNTPLTTDPDEIRAELKKLCARRKLGDVKKKTFERTWAQRTVDLYREVVKRRLAKDEEILHEHHTIMAHTRLTRSVLREPEQFATSYFATDRRLIRLRSVVVPEQPPRCDKSDNTVIDQAYYERIKGLNLKRDIRKGEMVAGVVIAAVGLAFYQHLQITGPFMVALGVIGFLHGFLLPARWLEVVTGDAPPNPDPIKIGVLRKKTARRLVRFVREKIKPV